MAWKLIENLGGLLGKRGLAEAPKAEVAVATCALEGLDPSGCRRLVNGEELCLEVEDGKVAARSGKDLVGYVTGKDSEHVARLVEQGAGLGCRVVHADRETPEVRVRICIRI